LIVKAIYLHSKQKILVVCYTNHALDQFLVDLMKVGIPSQSMVRLGSTSKATTATQPLVISNQGIKFKFCKADWDIIDARKSETRRWSQRFRDAFRDYKATKVGKDDLLGHLEFSDDHSHFYDAFQLPEQNDGMTRIDRRGKAIEKHYLLDRWAGGKNAGIFQTEVENLHPEVWKMGAFERQSLLNSWKSEILRERISRLCEYGSHYDKSLSDTKALFNEKDRRVMAQKRIIACTTSAAAKYFRRIQSVSPDVLLVEEAGEILESHVLTALGSETDQLILIGDHKQLRPKAHHDLSVEKQDGYDLNRSLFERLVIKGYPHETLSQQHRMRPEISSLVRHLTYPDLSDAPSTRGRPDLRGFQNNLMFINHQSPEEESQAPDWRDGPSSSSKKNLFEAEMTLKCVKYLAQQGYRTDQVVVLTPYVAQLRLLHDVLRVENDPVLNDMDSYDLVQAGLMPAATARSQKRPIRISTIDNYQGEECDIVLVSLTRSNARGDIGFLSSPERLNVLLSRARNALILIGNASMLAEARKGATIWKDFLGLLKDGSNIYDGFPVKCERHPERQSLLCKPEDFGNCPDGGCDKPW
jgi:AAA domain